MILFNPFHILKGTTKKVVSYPLRTSLLQKILDTYQIMTGSVSLLNPEPDEKNKKRIIFSQPNELTMTRALLGNLGDWLKKPNVRTLGIYDYLTLGIAIAVEEGLLGLFNLSFNLPIIGVIARVAIRVLLFFTTMLRMMVSTLLATLCSPVALFAQMGSSIYYLFHEKVVIPDIQLETEINTYKEHVSIGTLIKQVEKDISEGKHVTCLSEVTAHDDIAFHSLRSQGEITTVDIENFCQQAHIQAPACFMVKSARSHSKPLESLSSLLPCHVIEPNGGYKNIEEYKKVMLPMASERFFGPMYVIDGSTRQIYLIRNGDWVDPGVKMSERLFKQYQETFKNRSAARTPQEINEWFISKSIKLYPYLEQTCYGLEKDASGVTHVRPIDLPEQTIYNDRFHDYYRAEKAIRLDQLDKEHLDTPPQLFQYKPQNKDYNQLASLLTEHHHHKRYIEINEKSTNTDDRDGVLGLSANELGAHKYSMSFFASITDEHQLDALEKNGLYNPELDTENQTGLAPKG